MCHRWWALSLLIIMEARAEWHLLLGTLIQSDSLEGELELDLEPRAGNLEPEARAGA